MAAEPATSESKAPAKSGGRGKIIQIMVIVALMALEGVAVFYFANAFNGPPAAAQADMSESSPGSTSTHGGESSQGEGASTDPRALGEVLIAECRTSNRASGKLIYFRVKVVALVQNSRLEHAQKLIEVNGGRIQDRINFVFRSADLAHFSEPNLDTIKRRIKHELERILDDEKLLQEILLPDFTPSGGGL